MPKFPKPFFRTARRAWYVQLGGKQISLGCDQDAAFRRYHELMSRPRPQPQRVAGDDVLRVLDAFLGWCQTNKARRTYDWYRQYLQSFARTIPRGLTTAELKPFHVQQWLDGKPGWKTGKRGAVIAVVRAFNWAVRMGHLNAHALKSMEKPRAGRRDCLISDEQFAAVLSAVRDADFRELLTVCWETGCRPQEAVSVEAAHVDGNEGVWVFPVEASKGKTHQRIVYLTEAALAITRRRMAASPVGPLFRNTNGRPWSASALNCRFARLRLALGRRKIEELGRHAWLSSGRAASV